LKPERSTAPIFIFGPVGAGKSTAAHALAARLPGALLVPEPVDANPFLPLYAVDQARWALACQTHYYLQYAQAYADALAQAQPAYALVDAGAPTNRHVYGRYLREQAIVTPDEYALYETLTDIMAAHYAYPQPAVILSVEASLECCYARVQGRGRAFEVAGHSRAYIAAIHRYTGEMIAMYATAGARILRFDAERWDARSEAGGAALAALLAPLAGSAGMTD
jgi:deoxyadenosine/deoxycytidine kinase